MDMKQGTSVQTGLQGLGKENAQVKAFEESNTAAGAGGSKPGLVDIEAEKRKAATKPLPGQLALKPRKRRARRPHMQDIEAERLKESKGKLDYQIQAIAEDIKANPLRKYLPLVTRAGNFRGEIKYLTKAQYRKYLKKEPPEAVIDKNGKIPWHYAIDQLASEAGYKSDEDLKEAIEKLAGQYGELESLRQQKRGARADIQAVKGKVPEIKISKLTNEEPPVFKKNESTTGVAVEVDGLEMKAVRNPSFYQIKDDNPATPDIRVRYSADARKLMGTAAREYQQDLALKRGVRLPRSRPPRITPRMPSLR